MNKKLRWITETAVMLALLVALQFFTKPMGQLVTGSCVNAVLAVSVLFAGLYSGLTVALVSPVLAFLLGIAPQLLTVPAIMLGNAAFVLVLHFIAGKARKNIASQLVAWVSAAAVKFGVLYAIVVWLICDVLSQTLLANGALKAPMLKVLPVNFGITQLFTALIGGGVALAIAPVLRKALKK
ncbi:MAG: ECF transporter S component [Ruminococcaceae bacterium]|nr:ECF transporter S component [Oscillospiraceae bacterium]